MGVRRRWGSNSFYFFCYRRNDSMCVCDGKDLVDDLGGKIKGVVKVFFLVVGGVGV